MAHAPEHAATKVMRNSVDCGRLRGKPPLAQGSAARGCPAMAPPHPHVPTFEQPPSTAPWVEYSMYCPNTPNWDELQQQARMGAAQVDLTNCLWRECPKGPRPWRQQACTHVHGRQGGQHGWSPTHSNSQHKSLGRLCAEFGAEVGLVGYCKGAEQLMGACAHADLKRLLPGTKCCVRQC
jgi:hypothetical protein